MAIPPRILKVLILLSLTLIIGNPKTCLRTWYSPNHLIFLVVGIYAEPNEKNYRHF